MADEARNRLVKKRDDLKELRKLLTQVHGDVYIKILTSSPRQTFLPDDWRFLIGLVNKSLGKSIHFESHQDRVDPFPGGSQCLWWLGNPKSVEEFCKWADDTAIALREYLNSLPPLAPDKGYYGTLATLCAVALTAALGEPPLVDRRRLRPGQHPRLPPALARPATPVVFHVLDVEADAVTFALDVLDHLLGNVPRLHVDVDGQIIVWKGRTYPVRRKPVLIMRLLNENLGKGPLTEQAMKASCPELKGVNFNHALRKTLPRPLRGLVKSERGKGRWLQLN
jgi:hypothetical protein